jgi:hypothetical protein
MWFKQARKNNASTGATHTKENALHIATHLGTATFSTPNGWFDKFKKRHKTVYRALLDGNRSVDPERLKTGKNYRLLQANEGYI